MRGFVLLLFLIGAATTAAEPPPGLVVETVAPGMAADAAGLKPGDVLLRWHRAAAPPAAPEPAEGTFLSPLDLEEVRLEQAPRGSLTITGRREGEALSVVLPSGPWRLTVRPRLPEPLRELYLEGALLLENEAEAERRRGLALWRQAASGLQADEAEIGAWLWWRIASTELELGVDDDAESSFGAAVAAAQRVGGKRPAQLIELHARVLSARGRLQEAALELERALSLRDRLEPRGPAAATILTNLGNIASAAGRLEKAEASFREALSIQEEQAPSSLDLGWSLTGLGMVAGHRGELDAAEAHFRRALELQQSLVPDGLPTAGTLTNLGTLDWMRGDLERAEARYLEALAIREGLDPESRDTAIGYNNLGSVAANRGDLATAERHFERALAIKRKLAPGSLDVAVTVLNLGNIASSRGDLALAESRFRHALRIYVAQAPESPDVAVLLHNLGKAASARQDWTTAEAYFHRSLALKEQRGGNRLDVATTIAALGMAAWTNGRLEAAGTLLERALETVRAVAPEGPEAGLILASAAGVERERGTPDRAEEHLRRSIAILEAAAPGSLELAASLHNLGDLHLESGELDEAETSLLRALDLRRALAPDSAAESETLHRLASLRLRRGEPDAALDLYRRSLAALESQAARLGGGHETRGGFLAEFAEVYRDMIDLLVDRGELGEAFHTLERSRVRGLLALFAERDLLFTDLSPALETKRRLANAAYERTLSQLAAATGRPEGEAQRRRLQEELAAARRRQEEVQAAARLASPRLASLEGAEPLTLDGARRALDPGTLVLAYSIGERRSHLFAVGAEGGTFAVLDLDTDRERLTRDVERFRRLWGPDGREAAWLRGEAARLTATLLAPAKAAIAAAERLVVVPDGPLHYLPFAALGDPGGDRYLVEAAPISVVASTTLWQELKAGRAGAEPVAVAAFGDPLYPGSLAETGEPQLRAALAGGLELPPLPSTRLEVAALERLYGERAEVFLGPEAREETAKRVAPGVSILHFATHGLADDRSPLSSALVLSLPEAWQEGRENGLLQAWEIFEQLRIDAELVTLSACETALGKDGGGEGLLGLTRAFQLAGARTVLASLRAVSDESTAALMERFYAHLRAGKSKDRALREAQLELIAGPIAVGEGEARQEVDFSHPFYWAPFQLFGDWK